MRKRLLSLFCALSLLLTLLPTSAFAVGDGAEGTTAQTKDTEVAEPAPEEPELTATAEWVEFTLTPVTASPDDDFPALFDYRDGAEAPATWSEAFFGDQLTALCTDKIYADGPTQGKVSKDLYDALCNEDNLSKLKAGTPITITVEEVVSGENEESATWKAGYDKLVSHVKQYQNVAGAITSNAIAAFDRDRSDIFWLGTSHTRCGLAMDGVLVDGEYEVGQKHTYSIQLQVHFDISNSWKTGSEGASKIEKDIQAVTAAVTERVTEANKKTSTYEKLLTVHNWLTQNNAYNEDAANVGNNADNTPWEAISALDTNLSPVCEGYARAFKLICDELKIPCVLVSGDATSSDNRTGAHMWNYVQMEDGNWYAVDVTWDDPVIKDSSGTTSSGNGVKTYFLVGGNTIVDETTNKTFNGNHTANTTFMEDGSGNPANAKFAYPELSAEKYEKPATITFSSTYPGWESGFIYTGSPITADTNNDYITYKGNNVPEGATYEKKWQKKDGNGYTDLTVTNGPTDVGEYKLIVTAKKDDQTVATGTQEFKILPLSVNDTDSVTTVSLAGISKDAVYTGEEHTVNVVATLKVGEGTPSNLTVGKDYTVTVTGQNATVDGNTVKATDAGEYTVTVTGTGNFTDEQAKTFTIAPKEVALTWNNITDRKWNDGKTVTATATGTVNNDEVSVTVSGGDETTMGEYTATATALTGEKAKNYKLPTVNTQNYTIGKADATGVAPKAEFSVRFNDTTEKTVAISNFTGLPDGIKNPVLKGDSITEKKDDNSLIANGLTNTKFQLSTDLKDEGLPKTASWNVTITSDNYADITATVTVTVTSKDVNKDAMKVEQADFVYGEGTVNPQITGVEGAPTFTYRERDKADATESSTAPTDAGKYTVIATLDTENTVYTASADFEITRKSIAGATVTLQKDDKSEATTTLELPYTGVQQTVKVGSVTLGDKNLKTEDYTVDTNVNGTNAGQYTVTVTGKGNYTGTAQVTWKITPATLTIQSATLAAKTYDGTKTATVESVSFGGLVNSETLGENDYTVTGTFDTADAGENKNVTVTVTLKDTDTAKNYTLENGGIFKKENAKIDKADQDKPTLTISSNQAFVGDKSVPTLTANGGKTGSYTYTSSKPEVAEVNATTGELTIKAAGTTELTVKSKGNGNYNESEASSPVTLKVLSSMTLTVMDTKAKTEELKAHLKNEGAITVSQPQREDGTNNFTVEVKGKRPLIAYESSDSSQKGPHKWIGLLIGQFTVNGGAAAGLKTLEYAIGTTDNWNNLYDNDVNDASSVGGDGTQLVLWIKTDVTNSLVIFLKDSSGNVAQLTINFTEYTAPVTPSQPSGGSTSGSGTVKTDTVTNPDGSVTKTETKRDGTVIETTTGKDGSVSKTTTNPNGSSVTETKAADGSMGTVKTDERGQTTAQTTLSSKAIETAKRNGEPVKAPVEVNATRDSSTAPTVKIELPRNSGDTNVEIPVTNVKPGTVAVIVHPDGTEEIVKNSRPTEDGIQLTVNGGATVKIVDNSKDFIDTQNHWAKDAIDFVSARGLVDGMNAVSYAPDASTTRAQLWTILARQNNADLSGGTNWYEKAQLWAKDKGVSDGANPNGTINRAQMVTMLWRTMGQPAAASGASFADVPADSYYAQAVAWAIENGITTGVGGGRFDPNSACTRGQIATFLYRYMK